MKRGDDTLLRTEMKQLGVYLYNRSEQFIISDIRKISFLRDVREVPSKESLVSLKFLSRNAFQEDNDG